MSKCPMCHGDMVKGTTTFTSDLGFGVIVVRQVPANVCSMCGESWLSDSTSEQIENIVLELRRKHSVVEVLNWADIAPLAA